MAVEQAKLGTRAALPRQTVTGQAVLTSLRAAKDQHGNKASASPPKDSPAPKGSSGPRSITHQNPKLGDVATVLRPQGDHPYSQEQGGESTGMGTLETQGGGWRETLAAGLGLGWKAFEGQDEKQDFYPSALSEAFRVLK